MCVLPLKISVLQFRMMSHSILLSEERCQALVYYIQGNKRGVLFTINDKQAQQQQEALFEVTGGVLFHKIVDLQPDYSELSIIRYAKLG